MWAGRVTMLLVEVAASFSCLSTCQVLGLASVGHEKRKTTQEATQLCLLGDDLCFFL